jgi:hypothetical protein
MTDLLQKAIDELKRLPADAQDAIASELIAMIQSERRWDTPFTDPRSKAALRRLAAEAEEEIERGEVYDFDPSTRPKP